MRLVRSPRLTLNLQLGTTVCFFGHYDVGPDRTTGICLEERKLAKTTVETHISALRLLYIRVLSGAR